MGGWENSSPRALDATCITQIFSQRGKREQIELAKGQKMNNALRFERVRFLGNCQKAHSTTSIIMPLLQANHALTEPLLLHIRKHALQRQRIRAPRPAHQSRIRTGRDALAPRRRATQRPVLASSRHIRVALDATEVGHRGLEAGEAQRADLVAVAHGRGPEDAVAVRVRADGFGGVVAGAGDVAFVVRHDPCAVAAEVGLRADVYCAWEAAAVEAVRGWRCSWWW